jgi:hypothetical protein
VLQPLKDDFIARAIIKILSTIRASSAHELEGQFEVIDKVGDDFWKYVAFCAATKEFEYSLRDLSNELMLAFGECSKKLSQADELTPSSLLHELYANVSISDDQRRIGARFICSFCCVAATLPIRRGQ